MKCGWILFLFAAAVAAQSTLDLTQRYLLLNTMRESTLKQELDEAAAAGYRVLAGAGSRDLVLEKVARPPDTYRYFLAHGQDEVKAAGLNGFRLSPLVRARRGDKPEQYDQVFLMEKFPGSIEPWTYSTTRLSDDSRVVRFSMGVSYENPGGCIAVMETPAGASAAPDSGRITTRTLWADTAAKLEQPVRDVTAAGYRVVAGCDGSLVLLLEKTKPPREPYPSLILAAKRAATMQQKLNEAGRQGFRLLPAAIGVYMKAAFGVFEGLQTETYAVVEKDPQGNGGYEYLLVTGQADLNSATARGYEVVAMEDLEFRGNVVFLEKRLPPRSAGH